MRARIDANIHGTWTSYKRCKCEICREVPRRYNLIHNRAVRKTSKCLDCGISIMNVSVRCKPCAGKFRSITGAASRGGYRSWENRVVDNPNPDRIWKLFKVEYRIANNLRSRLNQAIRNNAKAGSAVSDLGCTIPELKAYLESKFQDGMTWDNWSRKGWHIDHIKPLSKFDLNNLVQFKEAVHYINLQPLWAFDNVSKGAK